MTKSLTLPQQAHSTFVVFISKLILNVVSISIIYLALEAETRIRNPPLER